MNGGKLHVIAVEGLLHHGLVKLGRILPASLFVTALHFCSHCHKKGSRTAGKVGHIEGCWELVVAPVNLGRPVVKNKPGQ